MFRIDPLIRITLGLVSVTLILVLVGDYVLQLTRDQSGVDFRQREKIGKTLALQFSPLAEINSLKTYPKEHRSDLEDFLKTRYGPPVLPARYAPSARVAPSTE